MSIDPHKRRWLAAAATTAGIATGFVMGGSTAFAAPADEPSTPSSALNPNPAASNPSSSAGQGDSGAAEKGGSTSASNPNPSSSKPNPSAQQGNGGTSTPKIETAPATETAPAPTPKPDSVPTTAVPPSERVTPTPTPPTVTTPDSESPRESETRAPETWSPPPSLPPKSGLPSESDNDQGAPARGTNYAPRQAVPEDAPAPAAPSAPAAPTEPVVPQLNALDIAAGISAPRVVEEAVAAQAPEAPAQRASAVVSFDNPLKGAELPPVPPVEVPQVEIPEPVVEAVTHANAEVQSFLGQVVEAADAAGYSAPATLTLPDPGQVSQSDVVTVNLDLGPLNSAAQPIATQFQTPPGLPFSGFAGFQVGAP